MKIFRMGHQKFSKLEQEVSVRQDSIRAGLTLHSESGRVTQVTGVQSARTRNGTEVMIAPNGAVINHPEHGTMELPPGAYEVDQVREARPEEERARTIRFEAPDETTTALRREHLD